MKKRSSKAVQLLLITSLLASCNKPAPQAEGHARQEGFMRPRSAAQYPKVTNQYAQQRPGTGGMGGALLWYMASRHLGGGMGYASSGIKPRSVVGTNTAKS